MTDARAPAACLGAVRRRAHPRRARASRVRGGRVRRRRGVAPGGGGAAGARADGGGVSRGADGRGCGRISWVMRTGRRLWDGRSVHTEILSVLGAGGMGEVYRAAMRNSAAMSPSRSCPMPSFQTRSGWRASNAKPGAGGAQSSAHRRHLRLGGGRRHPRPRAGARGRRDARRSLARPVAVSRSARRRAPDRGSAGSGARERDRPPRSETGQHQDHAGRRR